MDTLVVWKYEIPVEDTFTLEMPAGAQILTVQVEPAASGVMVWALVDLSHARQRRSFRLAGTGEPIDHEMSDLRFIGSFQLQGGALVFHLFEVLGQP